MTGRALSAVMALVVLAGMAAAPLSAQTWSAEQQEVWALELASWEAIKNKDLSWIDQYTHTNLLAWDDQRPMPRGKEVFRE
ncbi:MAG TPA: hypothetical protein VLC48_06730, partial [Gemmatimonadota bacterium]|nr:hypothetical protein [Gemmatimonadota bacterium]